MTRYLLPCRCSRTIAVTAAQAGGAVRCSGCGADVAVPRLGALGRLETEADASALEPGRDWNSARSLLLAGVVVALIGAATAGWLRSRRAGVAPVDDAAIRAAVAAAPGDEVYASWLEFAGKGIARPPLREEQRRVQQARVLAALETAAWIVAGVGCLSAVSALVAGAARRRDGGPSR